MTLGTLRGTHEIEHGRRLAEQDTELVWGWGTPAGRLRAERRAGQIAEGAGLGPGLRALEVGCGTGLFTQLLAASGAQILAVDISADLLERARERGLPAGQVRFLERRFEDCDTEEPFDAVVGSSILHHLDLAAALPKLLSLLKPGGRLSFAEPNLMNPQILVMYRFRSFFPEVSPDEEAFTRWWIEGRLRRTGFTQIRTRPFDWLHPAVPERLIPGVRAAGAMLERVPLLREFAGSILITARRPAGAPQA